jgi:hypothetical protein
MTVRAVISLLAIVLMAGCGVHQAVDRHAVTTAISSPIATPTPTPTFIPTPSSFHSVPVESPRPALIETGPGRWATTVLLTDVLPACYYLSAQGTAAHPGSHLALLSLKDSPPKADVLWDLVAEGNFRPRTIPDTAAEVTQVVTAVSTTSNSVTANFATARSCEVTLTFAGLLQVPEAASLVFNSGETSFAIPLTVIRHVSLLEYLIIPAIAGLIFILCLILILIFVKGPGLPGGRLLRPHYWRSPVTASGAWTMRDSWATNVTSGILTVGIIMASTTASRSLFPGVTLSRFVLVDIAAGCIVLAAPAVFSILRAQADRRLIFESMHRGTDDSLIASLATVLVTATVTMFGIGVEVGTLIVLVHLSEASLAWQLVMFGGITLAAILLLWYAVTAVAALVGPLPSSLLVNRSDTSFTL